MKRNFNAVIAVIMAIAMVFSLAACGKEKAPEVNITDALELMNTVWDGHADSEKFPAAGGTFSADAVMDAPGKVSMEDSSMLEDTLCLPADSFAMADGAASLVHMMNANTFTAAAFHTAKGTEAQQLAKTLRDSIKGRQWMCGIPDKLAVIMVGDYVVYAFGSAELVDTFKTHTVEAYPMAELLFEESVI